MKPARLNIWLIISALVFPVFVSAQTPALIDAYATAETKNLFANLYKLSGKQILFGHQHATEYGHGWKSDQNTSDVKKVTGSHPSVIGIDLMQLAGVNDDAFQKEKDRLVKVAAETYDRGGVITISWHARNPVNGGDFYYKDSETPKAVPEIIPGGNYHEVYRKMLAQVAAFAKGTKGKDGRLVPMIFRPFHEFDGDWFWWGKSHCTKIEFVDLWKFTVNYLRDTLGVHNFIYAFSPDCTFTSEEDLLERFPGKDYVDLIGMDDYADFGRYGKYQVDSAIYRLTILSNFATRLDKLAALTETGLESIPNVTWWTETLLKVLMQPGLKLCYVLVWRNDAHSPTHYYAPFPGHSSVPDFMKFYDHPFTLFENDLPELYKKRL